ncbi:hypothetical protein SAMD00019534_026320 [Acytostelium subglobosum LB1]|uniref:hypothetical protein n=1 Tax=Acytostelium subglobosum LB1 TaxID=1410327 RepID=UPI000644D7BD|nr:hypothetical protein SAMD00019534_026320 [Acytostelium subglobosum LB1]GAM19457.1 hypothetical protein SAMD00019534_026320 [Acytostelium subglobosum LB1]|eukprot:XP_012757384.1 hypothetical protein SAMD00019534_026320 [Acytostelium subglobosum LB1]
MPRLKQLWSTLQQCASSYQSLEQNHSEITSHFEQLIKVIIAQEHKAKKPIIEQMENIQSTINNIIKEINDINQIIDPSSSSSASSLGDLNNNNNNNDQAAVSQVISSITSCSSIEQFINSTLVSSQTQTETEMSDNDDAHMIVTNDDITQLSMIRNHSKYIDQGGYPLPSKVEACLVTANVIKLGDIKKQIGACFRDVAFSQIFSMRNKSLSVLSLESSRWTHRDTLLPLTHIASSVVHAGNYIYVFGGKETPKSYLRYSLDANMQLYTGVIDGVDGGRAISACYDGDKLIYLVGGSDDDKFLNRVDCFDISTQQFKKVGQLPLGMGFARVHYHRETLLVIGGETQSLKGNRDIISFNVNTRLSKVIIKDILNDYLDQSCYNGRDNIYLLTKSYALTKFTLSNKQTTSLQCPLKLLQCPLIYDRYTDIIYRLGGKGKNYSYSTQDDLWRLLDDDDTIDDRSCFGSCLFERNTNS